MDNYTNIPGQLKHRSRWVVWGVKDAPPKAPYNPTSLLSGFPQPAKAGVRETWGTFQSAMQCVSKGMAKGIGYEFDGQALYGIGSCTTSVEIRISPPEIQDVDNQSDDNIMHLL